jgi:hypothetical protein
MKSMDSIIVQKKSVGPKNNTNEKYKNNKCKGRTQNNKKKRKNTTRILKKCEALASI